MTRADLKKPGAAFGLLLTLLLGFEGVRYVAYRDVAGVPTICAGHTEGVVMGQVASPEICRDLLSKDAYRYWEAVDRLVKVDMEPWQWAALSSFAFNMGIGALESSTLLRLANQGRWVDACHELPKWNKARRGADGPKVVWPGLVKRRTQEMFICLGYVFDDEYGANHRPVVR